MSRTGGVFFAISRQLLSREIFLIAFGVIDILVLIGECLRIQVPAINKIFLFVLGRFAPPSMHTAPRPPPQQPRRRKRHAGIPTGAPRSRGR